MGGGAYRFPELVEEATGRGRLFGTQITQMYFKNN